MVAISSSFLLMLTLTLMLMLMLFLCFFFFFFCYRCRFRQIRHHYHHNYPHHHHHHHHHRHHHHHHHHHQHHHHHHHFHYLGKKAFPLGGPSFWVCLLGHVLCCFLAYKREYFMVNRCPEWLKPRRKAKRESTPDKQHVQWHITLAVYHAKKKRKLHILLIKMSGIEICTIFKLNWIDFKDFQKNLEFKIIPGPYLKQSRS